MNCNTGEFSTDQGTIRKWFEQGDRVLLFDIEQQANTLHTAELSGCSTGPSAPSVNLLEELGAKIVDAKAEAEAETKRRSADFVARINRNLMAGR